MITPGEAERRLAAGAREVVDADLHDLVAERVVRMTSSASMNEPSLRELDVIEDPRAGSSLKAKLMSRALTPNIRRISRL